MLNQRERADLFTKLVGLELKGTIVSHGFTAAEVAATMGRSPSAFNRWVNGKSDLPLTVLCEACEVINAEPGQVVQHAYDRLLVAHGEPSGETYAPEDAQAALAEIADLLGDGTERRAPAPRTPRKVRAVADAGQADLAKPRSTRQRPRGSR